MQVNRKILLTTILLFTTILFFALNNLDLQIQDYFYSKDSMQWILSKHTEPYHFIFYTFAKKIPLILFMILLFIVIFHRKKTYFIAYKKSIYIVLLSIPLVTGITVGIKNSTNMPCPKHTQEYGGKYPHTAIWQAYKVPYNTYNKTHCWPAGHASGGFALMSLFFLFRRKRTKYLALGATIALGWSMGIYKMLIGDHFFSHTLISMLLAWLIILIITSLVDKYTSTV